MKTKQKIMNENCIEELSGKYTLTHTKKAKNFPIRTKPNIPQNNEDEK